MEAIALGKAATVSQKQLFGLSATQALQHSCFPLPALTPSSPTHSSQQDPQPPAPPWRGDGSWGEVSSHSPQAVLLPRNGRRGNSQAGKPAGRTCRGAGSWHGAQGYPEATKGARWSWSIPPTRHRRCRELLVPATESKPDGPWQAQRTRPRVLGTLCHPGVVRPLPGSASLVARGDLASTAQQAPPH